MSQSVLAAADQRMTRAVEALERELAGVRTGRASTGLVERITVDYYGTATPLNQLAGLSVPEAHLIVIQPWDRSVLSAIEKAITKSDIGLQPVVDGTVVRRNVPPPAPCRRRRAEEGGARRRDRARRSAPRARRPPEDHRPSHRRGRYRRRAQ